jgi:hypothetical protein
MLFFSPQFALAEQPHTPEAERTVRNKKLLWIAFTALLAVFAIIQFVPDPVPPEPVESPAERPRAQRG